MHPTHAVLSGGEKIDLSKLGPAEGWTWGSLAKGSVVEWGGVSALKGDVAVFTGFCERFCK